jgi:predicted DNA-binding transcriptional regulator AlpA
MRFLNERDLTARGIPGSKVTRWRKEKQGKFPRRSLIGERFYAWPDVVIDAYQLAIAAGRTEEEATEIAERARPRIEAMEAA